MRSERIRKNHGIIRIAAAFVLAAAMIIPFAGVVSASEPQAVPATVPATVPAAVPGVDPATVPAAVPAVVPTTVPAAVPGVDPATVPATVPGAIPPNVPVAYVAPDPVNIFLSQSAFIGNSVGEGLTMYNNAKGKVPLGNATMLTRVSYSFYADKNGMSKYIPKYAGTPMRAKDAIKQSGALYVFICMGTNDLVGNSGVEGAYTKYQEYLNGILAENPLVTIFIESCTPTRPGSNVSNEKVTAFNAHMKSYCDRFPNMHYVDIATPLMDETGHLAAGLSSDGSLHLTNKAYEIWANTIRAYIANFITLNAAVPK